MKKLSLYIFLVLMWCNFGFANDIRDFEIEGMSLDDNPTVLRQFSEKYYTEATSKILKKGTPYFVIIPKKNLDVYDEIHVHLDGKSQDKIAAITALIYTENIQKCMNVKKEIEMSLISEFKGAIMSDDDYKKIKLDKSGRSRFISTKFSVSSKDDILISCYDWDKDIIKKKGWRNLLALEIKLPQEELSNKHINLIQYLHFKNEENNWDYSDNKKQLTLDEKYYALLIANSDYDNWDNLNSPNKDINVISSILKNDYNYNVEVLKNANRSEILDKIFEYSNKVTDKDNLLIYYAGHGDIVNSNAYWIPKDGTKNISSTWLNTKDIESAISMISAKDLLVMIDSCFQGTAFKSGSQKIKEPKKNEIDDDKYFEKMLNYRSATVITSGNNEPVVDSTIEGHSHFAFKFIDILKKNNNYETSTTMFLEIKKYHATLRQSPNLYRVNKWGDLGGEFIFLKQK
jgi:hypothetical protein